MSSFLRWGDAPPLAVPQFSKARRREERRIKAHLNPILLWLTNSRCPTGDGTIQPITQLETQEVSLTPLFT